MGPSEKMGPLEKLHSNAMRGKWSEILETYKNESAIRSEKITATGDTLLHMAVSNGEDNVVENMVNLLVDEEKKRTQNNVVVTVEEGGEVSQNVNIVLGAENDRKNTPLHLAAIKGNFKMCKKIGERNPSLIARRNIMGETPLFLAALSGRKKAFLWLHYLYVRSPGVSSTDFAHCIRDNHDTILHCAIAQENIGVAIEIVHLYKNHMKEMLKRNKEELSPLHLLAAKRSAFRSTGLLEISKLVRPIYWFFRAKEKQATTREELEHCPVRVHMGTKLVKRFQKIENLETFSVIKFICWLTLFFLLFLLLPFSIAGRWFHQKRKMKQKHTWSSQIMRKLLDHASGEDISQTTSSTTSDQFSIFWQRKEFNGCWWTDSESMATLVSGKRTIETPLMIATKNGVIEMVEKILELFPSRIKDVNAEGKNIFLLAAECRQTEVFKFLCKQEWLKESDVFRQVDKEGNNALHLAARLGIEPDWLNLGEALSMSREINWFEFVKRRMPHDLLERYNRNMETPVDIFRESHKELMKNDAKRVAKTSQACSLVSTLVASVAFAITTNAPGGYDDNNGYAILRNKWAFKCFSAFSFCALFCSLISTICFLSVVASPSQSVHSWRYVPFKLYFGTYNMFFSIVCLWISFCSGHFFTLDDDRRKSHKATLSSYICSSLGIIFLVATQLHTFLGPILSSMSRIPSPRHKAVLPIEYRKD